MRADGVDEAPVSDEPSGISPAARLIFVSPDQLGNWRLRKSLSLDDARWYFDHERKGEATQCVRGARFAHHQVMRIKTYLRARAGLLELRRLEPDQRYSKCTPCRAMTPHDAMSCIPCRAYQYGPDMPFVPFEPPAAVPTEPKLRNSSSIKTTALTEDQISIARELGARVAPEDVAQKLGLSNQGIAQNMRRMAAKLQLADNREAVRAWAIENFPPNETPSPLTHGVLTPPIAHGSAAVLPGSTRA